jgi:prepilin-type N-terminal cleavage/methylation domain-containing protein
VTAARARPGLSFRAYTLIEILVVLAIISILGGLVMGGLIAARRHNQIQRCQFQLNMLEAKITEYETDFQDYPPSEAEDAIAGNECLLRALMTKEKDGPYIRLKDIRTCDSNGNGLPEIADEWGQPLRYLHHRNYGRENPNRRSYRLYSVGPDGVEDPFNAGSDDLANWKKGAEAESED